MTTTVTSTPVMSASAFRYVQALGALSRDAVKQLLDRSTSTDDAVRVATGDVISRVRAAGDRALVELAREYDGVSLDALEVPRTRWLRAIDRLDPSVRRAMERSAANIAKVHQAFLPSASETSPEPGIVVGRRPDPLGRVGVYAPGGRAAYPSSLLMGAVPARVAGVGEIVVCSPPSKAGDGAPLDVVLAAAVIAQADRVFSLGGAGAIAAMAYGTESVPRVDRIVGPGNAYVAEAKLQLAGVVGIDAPAGPSELLVIYDDSADLGIIARELLAQAEHDPRACVVAITVGRGLAGMLAERVSSGIERQPRRDVITSALANNGAILWADCIDEAIAFANRYAAEHVLLAVRNVDAIAQRLRNAGTIFLGPSSSVAFGDYMTGANHVLPTGGLARSYSGLSVTDFFRWSTYQRVSADAAGGLTDDVIAFATAEGLPGHAIAAERWTISRGGSR